MNTLSSLTSLKDKTALITGGAMGIGKAIALRYAEAGANIQLIDINESALASAAKEIESAHTCKVETFVVDLSSAEAITEFWEQLKHLPDILVNNAGVFWQSDILDVPIEKYELMMNINTRAVLQMSRDFIRTRGKKNPGTIVNISSIEARSGFTNDMTIYGASKAAVLAISRGLTKDYTPHGWKINTILPGGIQTPGATKLGLAAIKRLDFSVILTGIKFKSRLPYGTLGKPDDIARAALYLGLPLSDYLCGSELVVDGGFLSV